MSLMNSGDVRQSDKPNWLPLWYTQRKYQRSDGPDITDFAASLLRVTKGFRAGEPLNFLAWQQWLIDSLYERRDDGRLRYRRGLIGVGRKNGKSLLGSSIALHGLFLGQSGAEVYSCAGDRAQARIVFGEAKSQVLASPTLSKLANVYRDAIEVPGEGSVYRVLSSDAKLAQGYNPSLVIFDEVHVQPNDDLWDAMTLGSGARRDPLTIGITTAGFDMDTLCGRLYEYGKQVVSGEIEDETFGMWWWEPSDTSCDLNDKRAWDEANPNLREGLLDPDDMATSAQQNSPEAFRRYRLNQWTRSTECWLPQGVWQKCESNLELADGMPTWIGVDMALKHDSIAVALVQRREDRYIVRARVWQPDGDTIDVSAVENYLRELHYKYQLREVAYDPAYFVRSAQALADDGLPMVEFPQSGSRMIPACQISYELITSGQVAHDASPTLTDHVLSAAPRQTTEGWRLSKGKAKRKIDAAIAMVIALERASNPPTTESYGFVSF